MAAKKREEEKKKPAGKKETFEQIIVSETKLNEKQKAQWAKLDAKRREMDSAGKMQFDYAKKGGFAGKYAVQ